MERLRSLHCDYGQGYLFSPPVDAAAVEELIQARRHYRDAGGALTSSSVNGLNDVAPKAQHVHSARRLELPHI
ncbi:MAG: hypothetical protein H0W76_13115 [Pyrinomonadaceae bacterium]|nr:hypothetical protein [Pyrinomonadaceae bacterium]